MDVLLNGHRSSYKGLDPSESLWQLVQWVGARLETLHAQATDKYDKWNLNSLARACDPLTNPRLKNALEQLGCKTGAAAAKVPLQDTDRRLPGEINGPGKENAR